MRHALGEFGGATRRTSAAALLSDPGRREADLLAARRSCAGRAATARSACAAARSRKLGRILAKLDRGAAADPRDAGGARVDRGHGGRRCRAPQSLVLRSLLDPRLAEATLASARAASSCGRSSARCATRSPPTIVHGGEKINVIPSQVELELDGRSLPGFGPDDLIARGARARRRRTSSSSSSATTPARPSRISRICRRCREIIRELDPDAVPVPMLQIGVTDGRFFSRLGIQTYGFLPLRLPHGLRVHEARSTPPTSASPPTRCASAPRPSRARSSGTADEAARPRRDEVPRPARPSTPRSRAGTR